MNKFKRSTLIDGRTIAMEAQTVGEDCTVLCYGGDRPHIGAVALGVPYTTGQGGQSATVSLLSVQGHREGELCSGLARRFAKVMGCVVCVQCGIHYDGANSETIGAIVQAVEVLGGELLREWEQ